MEVKIIKFSVFLKLNLGCFPLTSCLPTNSRKPDTALRNVIAKLNMKPEAEEGVCVHVCIPLCVTLITLHLHLQINDEA